MVDLSSIATAVTALQGAMEIAKSIIGLRDADVLAGKVGELNWRIMDAQQAVFAVNNERSTLIERVGALEKELAEVVAWAAEKERYHLAQLAPGVLAYLIQSASQGDEPLHAICKHCYEDSKKSILNMQTDGYGGLTISCPRCKTEMSAYGSWGMLPQFVPFEEGSN